MKLLLLLCINHLALFHAWAPAFHNDFTTRLESSPSKNSKTYVLCGQCHSSYPLQVSDLGDVPRGRRLECTVCGHSWFQQKHRLSVIPDGFEMIPLPDKDYQRIQDNLQNRRSPRHVGKGKLFVGNIDFDCTEEDLEQLFGKVGTVGNVDIARDAQGNHRGFGFVTLWTQAEADRAVQEIDGTQVQGRTISVQPSIRKKR